MSAVGWVESRLVPIPVPLAVPVVALTVPCAVEDLSEFGVPVVSVAADAWDEDDPEAEGEPEVSVRPSNGVGPVVAAEVGEALAGSLLAVGTELVDEVKVAVGDAVATFSALSGNDEVTAVWDEVAADTLLTLATGMSCNVVSTSIVVSSRSGVSCAVVTTGVGVSRTSLACMCAVLSEPGRAICA